MKHFRRAAATLLFACMTIMHVPSAAQETTGRFVALQKMSIPDELAEYKVAIVIDYQDTSLDLKRLSLTPSDLRGQLGLTVVPTLEKARLLDKRQRFHAVMIVGAALGTITNDDSAWLSDMYRDRGVVGFIDVPVTEQYDALKVTCPSQQVNDYPWPWAAVHMYYIETLETGRQGSAVDLPHRCSSEWRQLSHGLRSTIFEWAIVDDIDFRGGAYYAFAFISHALDRVHGRMAY
jgi:hypothetical protein